MSVIRVIGSFFIVIAGVVLFTTDDTKLFSPLLIAGSLLVLLDDWRKRRA